MRIAFTDIKQNSEPDYKDILASRLTSLKIHEHTELKIEIYLENLTQIKMTSIIP